MVCSFPIPGRGQTLRPIVRCGLFLFVFLSESTSASARAQDAPSIPPAARQTYPDSAEGLQAQFEELTRIARTSDPAALNAVLGSLAIPNTAVWFSSHFDTVFLPQLQEDYGQALPKFQSHIAWVMQNFSRYSDFGLKVQPSESPKPLASSAFEALLPTPRDEIRVENYRFTSVSSNSKHGPPSWVSSFVYVDGRFRFVGGTYPFWAESLNALRGPMSLPAASMRGMTVQGVAFRHDQKGGRILGIVQLEITVERDGHLSKIKVLSGDKEFIQDAESYIKAARFPALPELPQLARAKRKWKFEVVFFGPKT